MKFTRSAPRAPVSRPRRRPPWLRSVEEDRPARSEERRSLRAVELICVLVVIAAVVGFCVWFLFLASGGPGPGTV